MENNDCFRFAEWVAKMITLEQLEYDFSDDIWFYQSEYTDQKIIQYDTKGLHQIFKMNLKFER